MINFDHKPCCPDGENALQIAKKLKKRASLKTNSLQFLLTKQLDTKIIPMIDLVSIDDFPKLNQDKIVQKIFFGSFQLKQCLSYIQDLIEFGKAFHVTKHAYANQSERINSNNLNYKILAFQIASRHKRSLIKKDKLPKKTKEKNFEKNFRSSYKVFVQYSPGMNRTKAIEGRSLFRFSFLKMHFLLKGYICSCKTGNRMAGCCVHVACVIYYLCYAKYTQLRLPAQNQRLIFIDMDKNEKPNKPRYVIRNRKKKAIFRHPEKSSSSDSDS